MNHRETSLIGYTIAISMTFTAVAVGTTLAILGDRWGAAACFGTGSLALLLAVDTGRYLLDVLRDPWRDPESAAAERRAYRRGRRDEMLRTSVRFGGVPAGEVSRETLQ